MNKKKLQRIVSNLIWILILAFILYRALFFDPTSKAPRPPIETAYKQGIEALVPMLFAQSFAITLLSWLIAAFVDRKKKSARAVPIGSPISKFGNLFWALIVLGFSTGVVWLTINMLQGMGKYYHYYQYSSPPIYVAGQTQYWLNLALTFLPLIISSTALYWLVCHKRRQVEITRHSHIIDISDDETPLPENVSTLNEALKRMNFVRLGEARHTIEDKDGIESNVHWYFIGDEGQVICKFMSGRGLESHATLLYVTCFSDGGIVVSNHPSGTQIHRHDLIIDYEPSNIESAYQLHRKNVTRFSEAHGESMYITDMRMAIEQEQRYETRHYDTIIDHLYRRLLVPKIGFVVLSALGVGITLIAAISRGLVGNNLVGFVIPTSFFSAIYWVYARSTLKMLEVQQGDSP